MEIVQNRQIGLCLLSWQVCIALAVVPFASSCTSKTVPTTSSSRHTLNSVADNDEKGLTQAINAAAGKEKYRLMCLLADRKANIANLAELEPLLQQISAQAQENFGADSVEYATALIRQAHLYMKQKDYMRSSNTFQQANALYKKKGPEFDCQRIDCISGQIAAECVTGKCAQEEALYKELLELRHKCLGDRNPQTVISMLTLGEVYSREHKYDDALKQFTSAYYMSLAGVQVDRDAVALNLARTYTNLKQYDKAAPLLQASKAHLEAQQVSGRQVNPLLLGVLKAYVVLYDRQKKYKDELVVAKRFLDLNEAYLGAKHPKLNTSLMLYADALEKAGKVKDAQQVKNRLRDLELNGDKGKEIQSAGSSPGAEGTKDHF